MHLKILCFQKWSTSSTFFIVIIVLKYENFKHTSSECNWFYSFISVDYNLLLLS